VKKTVWHDAYHWQYRDLPGLLRSWLLNETSLTQRLRAVCHDQFQVKILTEGWEYPQFDEIQILGLRLKRYARVRQVYLCCQHQPWIFGRTVIPPSTLCGKYRYLKWLGEKSIGTVLFAHHSLERRHLQLARLSAEEHLYALATANLREKPPLLYARRSVFYLEQKPLLVTEVFLPQILKRLASVGSIK
jgi:chorismate--pyruvate lyase